MSCDLPVDELVAKASGVDAAAAARVDVEASTRHSCAVPERRWRRRCGGRERGRSVAVNSEGHDEAIDRDARESEAGGGENLGTMLAVFPVPRSLNDSDRSPSSARSPCGWPQHLPLDLLLDLRRASRRPIDAYLQLAATTTETWRCWTRREGPISPEN